MMTPSNGSTALLLLVMAMPFSLTQEQRETIPEAVAQGAVSSVATVPSGQVPTMRSLLPEADLVVTGIVGDSRSYLSKDQRDIYTDYSIDDPVFLYQSKLVATSQPGMVPQVIVTQLGGTVVSMEFSSRKKNRHCYLYRPEQMRSFFFIVLATNT
jgi:hypothetical protein